jgi:hypothetical protein
MRLDVYQAKVAAQKNIKESGEWDKLSPEEKRLVDKMVGPSQSNHTLADGNHLRVDRFWMELVQDLLYQRPKGPN